MIDQGIQTYICKIQDSLKGMAEQPDAQKQLLAENWENGWTAGWTENVKRRIGCVSIGEGFEVYSTLHNKERFYDLCWVEKDGNMPLALECEWADNRNEIKYDFDKLLRSRASLRVMIFERWGPKTPADIVKRKAEAEIDNLICRMKVFSGSQSEATYLFCVHCVYTDENNEVRNEFVFCTHPSTAETREV